MQHKVSCCSRYASIKSPHASSCFLEVLLDSEKLVFELDWFRATLKNLSLETKWSGKYFFGRADFIDSCDHQLPGRLWSTGPGYPLDPRLGKGARSEPCWVKKRPIPTRTRTHGLRCEQKHEPGLVGSWGVGRRPPLCANGRLVWFRFRNTN